MRARSFATLLAAATLLLTAGCGGTDDGGGDVASLETTGAAPTTTGAAENAEFEKYNQCMRDNGAELQGGQVGDDGSGQGGTISPPSGLGGPDIDLEKLAEAGEKCKHLLSDGGVATTQDPELMDKQRAWARCLREKGYDVPDPAPDGRGEVRLPNDPETNKAVADCRAQAYGGS